MISFLLIVALGFVEMGSRQSQRLATGSPRSETGRTNASAGLTLALTAATQPTTATLAFVGDVNFRELDPKADIFAAVRPRLAAADLAIGNLEGLLLDNPTDAYREARINITASSAFVKALSQSGLDGLGLANNHTWDHGVDGLREHLAHLDAAGIVHFGAGPDVASARRPYRQNLSIGCVSIVPATFKSNKRPPRGADLEAATYPIKDPSALIDILAAERAAGCFVVAFVHAGKEKAPLPTPEVQRAFRRLAATADLVVGHHPHVLEGVERVGDAWIIYSLGNFLFVNQSAEKRRSAILEVTVAADSRPRIAGLAFVPVTIDLATSLPRLASDSEAADTARVLAERSRPFGVTTSWSNGRIVVGR